jgi:VanZ family protein
MPARPENAARHPEPDWSAMPLLVPPRVWRVAFLLCLTGVLVLSLVPATPASLTTGWDKTNHLLGFAVLGLLGLRSYPGRAVTVLLGLLAYGGLIEVLQSLTPYRLAEWADLLADALGLAVGAVLARLFTRKPPPGSTD